MRPKFISKAKQDACSTQGSNNLVTRSLLSELGRFGIKSENFVQIAAAKRDEVSWDEPGRGGMATQAISRCLLGEASDLNRSGAVSLDEVRACAQKIMDQRMAPSRARGLLPSTIQVSGNRNLVVTPSAPPAAPVVVQAPPAAAPAALRQGRALRARRASLAPSESASGVWALRPSAARAGPAARHRGRRQRQPARRE